MLGILAFFAVVTLVNMHPSLLAPSGYPPLACLVLAVVFKLDSIASIGSAVALVIFTLITAAHLRIRAETGASLPMLVLAIAAAGAVLVTFVFTTLIHEPASIVTLLAILVLSIGLDYGWKRGHHPGSPVHVQVGR